VVQPLLVSDAEGRLLDKNVLRLLALTMAGSVTVACGEVPAAYPVPPPPDYAGLLGHMSLRSPCEAAVRPLPSAPTDGKENGDKQLLPDRYSLSARSSDVVVVPGISGWVIRGVSDMHVDYDVRDQATGDVVFQGETTLQCDPSPSVHVLAPNAAGSGDPAKVSGEGKKVDNGTYIAANILGGTVVAAGSAGLIVGIGSMISAATSKGDSSLTEGIVLIDLAPHVLAVGIVTLAVNQSAHSRALARAQVARIPFIVPLPSGGALGGVGGTF
jgi:hypothetical protein